MFFFFRNVNHPNIVQVHGISIRIDDQSNKYLEMRMEHCPESLENLILKNKNFVPCGNLKDWNIYESKKSKAFYINTMSGISTGIAHLHEAGFIHKNLKMSNVFVSYNALRLMFLQSVLEINFFVKSDLYLIKLCSYSRTWLRPLCIRLL